MGKCGASKCGSTSKLKSINHRASRTPRPRTGRTSASDGKFCRLRHRTIPPSICGFLGLKNKLSLQGLPGEVLTIYEGAREAEVNDQLSLKVGNSNIVSGGRRSRCSKSKDGSYLLNRPKVDGENLYAVPSSLQYIGFLRCLRRASLVRRGTSSSTV